MMQRVYWLCYPTQISGVCRLNQFGECFVRYEHMVGETEKLGADLVAKRTRLTICGLQTQRRGM
jgi:hypothetical protein